MENSWIWEDNSTIVNDYNLCEDVTNHWLYFIFSGYLLPLISPRVRDWFKEFLNSMKNSEVGGKVVTLTEFGFQKIQDIHGTFVQLTHPVLLIIMEVYVHHI